MNVGNAIYFRNLTRQILTTMLEIDNEEAVIQYLLTLTENCPEYTVIIEGVVKETCPQYLNKWQKLLLVS